MDLVLSSGMLDYAVRLKREGVIRAVGMSSHDPVTALKMIETGAIDVLMFSINPAYDAMPPEADVDGLMNKDSYASFAAFEPRPERAKLYRSCEARGVGITVMKALGAGALLDARRSPFGSALTAPQCVHYALTRPAVSSVLVGCKTPAEVRAAAAYEDATQAERDYARALGAMRFSPPASACTATTACPARRRSTWRRSTSSWTSQRLATNRPPRSGRTTWRFPTARASASPAAAAKPIVPLTSPSFKGWKRREGSSENSASLL